MASLRFIAALALTWGLLVPWAGAQSPDKGVPASHGSPVAGTVSPGVDGGAWRYVSVLAQYQPYAEQPLASWPEANATVQRIGGWRAYAQEMRAPAPAPTPQGAQP